MMLPRVVGKQENDAAFLVHTSDVEIASGIRVPCARVYDHSRSELFPETYLDSIVKFGGWVEFDGSDEKRDAIEREVGERL